jgi:hypothetical protein
MLMPLAMAAMLPTIDIQQVYDGLRSGLIPLGAQPGDHQ